MTQEIEATSAAARERASFVQLYGPVQNEGSLVHTPAADYRMAGAATSTSFKKFWFNRAWQSITWAALKVEWIPTVRASAIRLIAADDGVVNIRQLAELVGSDNRNPVASAADITAALRDLARAGRPQNIGWQLRGDGRTAIRIYQVHLEILET